MFWYTKSNATHDKIKMQDFLMPVNCICEQKVCPWTNDIIFLGHLFMGRSKMIFWKKVVPSLTTFIFTTQIRYWLHWLRCLARLNIKIYSLVTTLTTLIYMKNSLITDYADYTDIQGNMKNSSSLTSLTTLIFNIRWEIISLLTALTMLILKTTYKIVLS